VRTIILVTQNQKSLKDTLTSIVEVVKRFMTRKEGVLCQNVSINEK